MVRVRSRSCFLAALCALFLAGCGVSQYTAVTEVHYKDFYYRSNKNQEGLQASGQFDPNGGALTGFSVSTTATTPEAAIAAALQSNMMLQQQLGELLKTLIPLIAKAAAIGASGGAAAPFVSSLGGLSNEKNFTPVPVPLPGGGAITPNVK